MKLCLLFLFGIQLGYAQMDMGPDGRPMFMQGWTEEQVMKYYQDQAKQRDAQVQGQMDAQVQEQRVGILNQALGSFQQRAQEKLQKARELRQKAQENQRVGFGKVQIKYDDFIRRKVVSMGMDLGTKEHKYGCYSQDQSSLGVIANKHVGGIAQKVKADVTGVDQPSQERLVLVAGKGTSEITFEMDHKQFKRLGSRQIGEIQITGDVIGKDKNGRKMAKLHSGGWIRYYGCPLDQAPSAGGAQGGFGGGY